MKLTINLAKLYRLRGWLWQQRFLVLIFGFLVYTAWVGLTLQRYWPLPFALGETLDIRIHALFVLAAIALAIWLFARWRKRIPELMQMDLWDLAVWTLLPAIICARFFHVIGNLHIYAANPKLVLMINIGGLNFLGGLLGAAIGIYIFTRYQKLPTQAVLGLLAVITPLAHIIGRTGNYFNREIYGLPTELPWKMYVEGPFRVYGLESVAYYHPLFYYEQLANLLLFGLLYWLYQKQPQNYRRLVQIYIVCYIVIRFMLDFLRLEYRPVPGLTFTQLAILILVMLSIGLGWCWQLYYRIKYHRWWKPQQK
jgi:phosphatidylglycerol:prolipoprotein diacylglycerol transferase